MYTMYYFVQSIKLKKKSNHRLELLYWRSIKLQLKISLLCSVLDIIMRRDSYQSNTIIIRRTALFAYYRCCVACSGFSHCAKNPYLVYTYTKIAMSAAILYFYYYIISVIRDYRRTADLLSFFPCCYYCCSYSALLTRICS